MTVAALCAVLAFMDLNLVSAVIAAALWLIAVGLLRMAAKADPFMRQVYFRQRRYRGYYPARSRPWARD